MRQFLNREELRTELKRAMGRLGALGVAYPPGYLEKLVEKYSSGVQYPRILMRIGEPRIRKHPCYGEVLKRDGDFLDYGCGTGDDVRALIKDGYPRSRIKGFDTGWNSIALGFDLYLDKESIQDMFVVSAKFPFGAETFDAVYSGSVLHTIRDRCEMQAYLFNAYNALRDGGVFFGSTLGTSGRRYMPSRWLLTEDGLRRSLENTGFVNTEIVRTNTSPVTPPLPRPLQTFVESFRFRFWFSGIKKVQGRILPAPQGRGAPSV